MFLDGRRNVIFCFRFIVVTQQFRACKVSFLNFFRLLEEIIVDAFGHNGIFPEIEKKEKNQINVGHKASSR